MKYNQPLFFSPNRTWRLYTGGKLLDQFTGAETVSDGHFPEEWLASIVKANNGDHTNNPDEGLSKIVTTGGEGTTLQKILSKDGSLILGKRHYEKYGDNTAILCKYLDSAVRLPIQCHPDAETSQKLFNSPFGKTECWHIIATRKIENEEPYILLGFKIGVDPAAFASAVSEQNIPKMIDMLHKIQVHPDETYFVPGRMPHAIGPGVFMLEVQEPSDWVIQPENYCADIKLSNTDMWGKLQPEEGLQVFNYIGYTKDDLMNRVSASNTILKEKDGIKIIELIGNQHTKAFGLWKVFVTGSAKLTIPSEFAIIVIVKGDGMLKWTDGVKQLKKSDYFLIPATIKDMEFSSQDVMEMLVCLPPFVSK